MPATLTTSGNEVTDTVRTTGTAGDGLAVESSYGIWEAATNLILNGGGETNATGHTAVSATVNRVTSQHKFGSASLEVVTSNAAANEGSYHNFTATVAVYTVSAWVRGAGGTVRMAVRDNAGANAQTGTAVTLTTSWQRIRLTTTNLTAAVWRAYVETDVQQNITFQFDGLQAELHPIATPYVETNGGTASRSAGRVQAPQALLSDVQSWVAVRCRVNWVSTSIPNAAPMFFEWRTVGQNAFSLYRASGTGWGLDTTRNTTVANIAKTASFAQGAFTTLIVYWTTSQIAISADGSVFTTNSRGGTAGGTALPSTFEIGSRAGTLGADSDFFWFACGSGTLTNADATAIHAIGNTDPRPSTFNAISAAAACTGVAQFDDTNVITLLTTAVGQAPETDLAQTVTGLVGAPTNTVAPTITGTVKVGHTVRALTGTWS